MIASPPTFTARFSGVAIILAMSIALGCAVTACGADSPPGTGRLGEAMRKNGDSKRALETLLTAAKSSAAYTNGAYAARANRAIGDIRLEDTGDYSGAVAAYRKFLAIRPDLAEPGFWMNYGIALMASGHGDEAALVFSGQRDLAVGDPAEFAKWDNMVEKCGQSHERYREAVQERGALAAMDVAEALLDGDEAGRALKIFRRVLPVARRLGLGDRCAIGDKDFLLGLENKDSSQNTGGTTSIKNANKQRICDKNIPGNPSDKEIRFPLQYASPVLTVWRLLHIEVDSMAAPPSSGAEKNFVEGNLTSVASFGTVAERVGLDINLRSGLTPPDNSANMSAGTGYGRFENGWIKIGSGSGTPGQTMASGLDGNGDDFVERLAGIDIPVVVTKAGQPDITGKVWEWNGNRFTLCSLSANLSSAYNGGTLNVAGVSSAIATITSPNIVNVTSPPSVPFILHDDDDDTILPKLPDVTQISAALSPCFTIPTYDVGVSSQNVSFKRNVALNSIEVTSVQEWDSKSLNAVSFWVAYILSCFQGDVSLKDHDPSHENVGFGVTPANSGGGLVFLEIHRASEGVSNPVAEEQDTVVHELGHSIGRSGAEPVTDGASRYTSVYVDAIRTAVKPWP